MGAAPMGDRDRLAEFLTHYHTPASHHCPPWRPAPTQTRCAS